MLQTEQRHAHGMIHMHVEKKAASCFKEITVYTADRASTKCTRTETHDFAHCNHIRQKPAIIICFKFEQKPNNFTKDICLSLIHI